MRHAAADIQHVLGAVNSTEIDQFVGGLHWRKTIPEDQLSLLQLDASGNPRPS